MLNRPARPGHDTRDGTAAATRPSPVRRRDGGFTLIEVLVSITLLAIGIAGALTVFVHADQGENVAQKHDVAAQAARQVIDELRARDYASLAVTDPTAWGTTGGRPTLGNAPVNASLSAATKTQLQTMFDRDRTVNPDGSGNVAGLQVGTGSGSTAETGLVEPAVNPQDPRQGSGKSTSSYQVVQVPNGTGGTVRVHVLSRVTWRDVQCKVLDLTNPLGQASSLLRRLGDLIRPSANGNGYSLHDLLLGSQGGLTKLLSGKDSLVQHLLTSISTSAPSQTVLSTLLAGVTNGVLSPVLTLVGQAVQQVTGALFTPIAALLDPVGQLLGAVVKPLADALDPILNVLTGPLSNLTDLCDLNLVDDGSGNGLVAPLQSLLPGLTQLSTTFGTLQSTLANSNLVGQLVDASSNVLAASNVSSSLPNPPSCPVLNLVDPCFTTWAAANLVTTLVRGVTGIVQDTVTPLLSTLTATLTSLPATIQGVVTTAGNLPTLLKDVATLLTSKQHSIVLNGYKNTKRITVAAWPEIGGRLVGTRPQYFSAVVANPKASLLSADQGGRAVNPG